MAEPITKVTKTSYGKRLSKSFSGILIGFILFLSAFAVLWWNEGRTDLSKVADDAVAINSAEIAKNSDLEGTQVSTYGTLATAEELGDPFVKPQPLFSINRAVEMYAWKEVSESSTETKLGGSQETTTTITYEKDWTSSPASSAKFEDPSGHTNPPLTVQKLSSQAKTGTIGTYKVDATSLQLTGSTDFKLTSENANVPEGASITSGGKYMYIPTKVKTDDADDTADDDDDFFDDDPFEDEESDEDTEDTAAMTDPSSAPRVGDVRVSFTVTPSPQENITVFGQLNGDKISPFFNKDNDKVYRAFEGTADQALNTLSTEHKRSTWMWRLIGFLMMWFGLASIFGPISVLLDFVPMFGSLSRAMLNFVAFIIALVLSLVTIVISAILHNVWALIVLVIALAGGGYWWFTKKKKEGPGMKKDSSNESSTKNEDSTDEEA